jgi:ABC-type sugar transport system permease subunit
MNTGNTKNFLVNFCFALPAILLFCVFYVYPFYDIIHLSLHEWNGIDVQKYYVHFENFQELFQDQNWWRSMWHAGVITFFALTFQNILAFALALACDQQVRLKKIYRLIFFIPPVLSEVVVGFIWMWILNGDMQGGEYIGVLNYFLDQIGLHHMVTSWLSNPDTVLICIALVHCWKGFGWGFIMLFAGLQTIDNQLYEAARVDGANAWQTFRNITIPMMVPVILVVIILTILGSMQVFVLIKAMVGQGLQDYTSVPVSQIFQSMIGYKRFGYACAQGVTFGVILICVSFTFKLITDRIRQY